MIVHYVRLFSSQVFRSNKKRYFSSFLVTLFQIPQYEHLQILICNGNSLTTLAGVEHIKHLWKLDVGNNQVDQILFSKIDFKFSAFAIYRFEVFNIYHVL
jgi:Leucine-rich repeat (LRR) protein